MDSLGHFHKTLSDIKPMDQIAKERFDSKLRKLSGLVQTTENIVVRVLTSRNIRKPKTIKTDHIGGEQFPVQKLPTKRI